MFSQPYLMAFVLLDNTHFKRKRSHKIERSLNCTEWKSALNEVFFKVIMQCDASRCVTCMSNNVSYLYEEQCFKTLLKNYIVILTDLCNAIKKILDNISCRRYLNTKVKTRCPSTAINCLTHKLLCRFISLTISPHMAMLPL